MTAGDQVPKEDLDAADQSKILYAVINKIDSTVSAICGSEITNRQEVRYYPRQATQESAKVNEILTAAAEWTRDECDAADEESEAFRDAIICGMGWTETRMSYDVDPDGMAVIERVDPLEMAWDPSAKRPNLADARYLRWKRRYSKAEAAEKFGIDPDEYTSDKPGEMGGGEHSADRQDAYNQGKGEIGLRKDEIEVTQYQWYELETAIRVANPMTGEIEDLTEEEFKPLAGLPLQTAQIKKRCYYRAYRIRDEILQEEKLPEDEFTLKCVTGKFDRNKRIWYGVVRAMRDPQKLLNKQVSQLQRIIDVNAKGGLLAEVDAFEDPAQAKEDWAASDTIVYVKNGTLGAHPRVMPKPVAQYPSAIDKMFMMTNEMVPGVSGVNNEMLGVLDREQAGVVEWQRKQAAYGVLAGFFNSLRRYRRVQGRHLLKLITKYMSDDRLIRIQGKMGDVRYVQLSKQPDTLKYDVIVDEAPAGPNQKERTFLFLMQMGPMLAKLGLPPQIWMKMMEYSPLPSSLIQEVQQEMQKLAAQPQQPDPKTQALMAKTQLDTQKAQFDMAAQQQQQVIDLQAKRMELQADQEAQQAKAENDAKAAMMQAEIKRYEAEGRMAIEQAKMQAQAALAQAQFEFEVRMQEREQAFDEYISRRELEMNRKASDTSGNTQFGGEAG